MINILDLLVLSFESLKERKVRTAFTIGMVVIGAALITGLNGLSGGMSRYMEKQFGLLGGNTIIALPASESFRITEQVCMSIRQMQGVEDAVPYIYVTATIKAGGRSQEAVVIGIDQTKIHLVFPTLEVAQGNLVPPYDSNGIVLGDLIANPIGEPTFAKRGQTVTIEYKIYEPSGPKVVSKSFRVKGVLAYMGTSARFIPLDRSVLISPSAANSLFRRGGVYDGIYIVAKDESLVEMIEDEIEEVYEEQLELYSAKAIIRTVRSIMAGFQTFTSSIAAISLIVASVGIFTAMYTSVMERRREIGILKAIGFNNKMVLLLFLNDALVIGMIGGLIGCGAGIIVAHVFSFFMWGWRRTTATTASPVFREMIKPVFSPQIFVFVWVFCVILSIIAGVYPAWSASRLDPVVALRRE